MQNGKVYMSEFIEHYIEHCRSCGDMLGEYSFQSGECYECSTPFSSEQRSYASINPKLYEQKIQLPNGSVKTVIEQAEYMNVTGKILAVFGIFAITSKGIECLTHEYLIEKSRLDSENWIAHMEEKSWVNMPDFTSALLWAKENL
jgi:ribosomal protein L37E